MPGVQNFLLRDKPLKPDLAKTSGGSCLLKILNIFPEKYEILIYKNEEINMSKELSKNASELLTKIRDKGPLV